MFLTLPTGKLKDVLVAYVNCKVTNDIVKMMSMSNFTVVSLWCDHMKMLTKHYCEPAVLNAMPHKKMYYKKKHFVLKPKVDSQQAYIKIIIMTLAVRIINNIIINFKPLTRVVDNGPLFSVRV